MTITIKMPDWWKPGACIEWGLPQGYAGERAVKYRCPFYERGCHADSAEKCPVKVLEVKEIQEEK